MLRMREPILALNAGSSSVKFSIFETRADRSVSAGVHGQIEGIGSGPRLEVSDAEHRKLEDRKLEGDGFAAAMATIQDWFSEHVGNAAEFSGVGHRVVHGGELYSDPVLIDTEVMSGLRRLVPLAPLHQPHNIAAIEAVASAAPTVPQVACFDTAFHRQQPWVARQFALPRDLSAKGIYRYGFHGISYEYIVSVLPLLAPECVGRKLIVAHLGNGASMCAIDNGRSVATTMGFSVVDGLPMGTRTGTLDPGVILYLLQQENMAPEAVERLIYEQSGLLGVSGISSDVRRLLESPAPSAKEAIELLIYRIGRELGSLAAALGGLDALIFTAGIGEHSKDIRAGVCTAAAWLGIALDAQANAKGRRRISSARSKVSVYVIPTDENLVVARHTRRLLDRSAAALT
jgi:acetate kinase